MLGAAQFDAVLEFVEQFHALGGKHGQETMPALLQFSIGIKVGDQFPFMGVEYRRANGHGVTSFFLQFGELKEHF